MPTGAGVNSLGVKDTWTRMERATLARMSTVETQYCYRHPDRETGLACSDCGRPICADCANFGPVGIRCPDHASVRKAGPTARIKPPTVRRAPGIALGTGNAPITKALIGINLLIYLVTIAQGAGLNSPGGAVLNRLVLIGSTTQLKLLALHGLIPPSAVPSGDLTHHHEWYRLVTAMFLHASVWHIGFNMYALWVIGIPVEQYLGKARYLGLYFVSGLAGSAGALMQSPYGITLGASGAIFGILGAMLVLEWQVTGRLAGQAAGLIAINLGLSFVIPGISWGGHVGGLIGGILIMFGYGHWSGRRSRAQYGQLGLGGVAGLILVAVGSVAVAYFQVRGLA
jgi:membrane associated rhomboid family serine protease